MSTSTAPARRRGASASGTKTLTVSGDPQILESLKKAATESGLSTSNYLETLLVSLCPDGFPRIRQVTEIVLEQPGGLKKAS
ncbi:hypothetical protein [Lysinibacter cavernae]|uniref:hypothetical protein n=1 Tax=Lysinibacter cavernae TaxID=1640652 RepID=UPI0036167269